MTDFWYSSMRVFGMRYLARSQITMRVSLTFAADMNRCIVARPMPREAPGMMQMRFFMIFPDFRGKIGL